MSSVIDVQNTLVAAAVAAVYPNGTAQPSVCNADIIAYAGWPMAAKLDADLLIGKSHITVFPTATEKNTTRYPRDWQQLSVGTATLTASIAGQTVVIGGAMPSPFAAHNIAVLVNNAAYVYSVQSNDTLTTIATGLKNLIVAGVPGTTSAGAVITLPNTANIEAVRVGVSGTSIREIRRQERMMQLTVWSDTPAKRDAIAAALDIALANTEFLTMPDGFGARLLYRGYMVVDKLQKAKLYRGDFMYSVEYATTETSTDMQITQVQVNASIQTDASTAVGTVRTNIY